MARRSGARERSPLPAPFERFVTYLEQCTDVVRLLADMSMLAYTLQFGLDVAVARLRCEADEAHKRLARCHEGIPLSGGAFHAILSSWANRPPSSQQVSSVTQWTATTTPMAPGRHDGDDDLTTASASNTPISPGSSRQ